MRLNSSLFCMVAGPGFFNLPATFSDAVNLGYRNGGEEFREDDAGKVLTPTGKVDRRCMARMLKSAIMLVNGREVSFAAYLEGKCGHKVNWKVDEVALDYCAMAAGYLQEVYPSLTWEVVQVAKPRAASASDIASIDSMLPELV
jgi:hypothetical protein